MIRRIGESAMWRRSGFLSRAKRALECRGLTPLFVARGEHTEIKMKVRDREDALASTRDACAARNLRCNAW
jgi:hypothetical protein